jgi:hypothetical protein
MVLAIDLLLDFCDTQPKRIAIGHSIPGPHVTAVQYFLGTYYFETKTSTL